MPTQRRSAQYQLGLGTKSLNAYQKTRALTVGAVKMCYATYTHAGDGADGEAKENQDCWMVEEWREGELESAGGDYDVGHVLMLGVLDGHGDEGGEVAALAAEELPRAMEASKGLRAGDVSRALEEACAATEEAVQSHAEVDAGLSGTTAVVVVLAQDRLVVSNLGDSRCIVGRFECSNDVVAYELTNDHTPALMAESNRVLAAGGRIAALEMKGRRVGPPRVWERTVDRPGLCVTRCIGDGVAKRLGVSAVPEVVSYPLTLDDRYLVLMSDGISEFITSQSVIEMVHDAASRGTHPDAVARGIVNEARLRWHERGLAADDCTIIIGYMVYDPDESAARAARLSLQRRIKARSRRATGAAGVPPKWVRRLVNWALKRLAGRELRGSTYSGGGSGGLGWLLGGGSVGGPRKSLLAPGGVFDVSQLDHFTV